MREDKESLEDPAIRLGAGPGPLEEDVPHDDGHTLGRSLAKPLGRYVEWVPSSPEVESGSPTA